MTFYDPEIFSTANDCERFAHEWYSRKDMGLILKLYCWNKEDADSIKKYMKNNYPDIPIICSWLIWGS